MRFKGGDRRGSKRYCKCSPKFNSSWAINLARAGVIKPDRSDW
jgi:hypothetical protein